MKMCLTELREQLLSIHYNSDLSNTEKLYHITTLNKKIKKSMFKKLKNTTTKKFPSEHQPLS